MERGKWRKYNPYNPYVPETDKKAAENLKVESLDDLFDEPIQEEKKEEFKKPEIKEPKFDNIEDLKVEIPEKDPILEPVEVAANNKPSKEIEFDFSSNLKEIAFL